MKKTLPSRFFARPALLVAEELIGTYLVRRIRGKEYAYMITETEAYVGPHDKACHAHKGRTKRTEVMFSAPGTIYVYLVYGMYDMLNIVTDAKEYPAAVLIRAVEGITGPGKLTRDMHITRTLNNKVLGKKNGLWIEDRGIRLSRGRIQKTPRIGIAYAKEWKEKPYRFVLGNHP